MYTCVLYVYLSIQFTFAFCRMLLIPQIRVFGQYQNFHLPMLHFSLMILLVLLSSVIFHVEAQSSDPNFPSDDEQSNFQPSVAVVIGILSIMFGLTFFLLVYAKFCHRRAAFYRNNNHRGTAAISASSRFSGINKTVIEALPFFRFSSLKGSKEGLECAVCLSKFEDIEILRLLPKCKHAFHINCIDNWLEKHSSCPLCRHKVSSEDLAFIAYSNSMRVLWNSQSERRQASNLELFVQREADHRGSSRFSIGSSFRKTDKVASKEDELLMEQEAADLEKEDQKMLHKQKHKIVVSDFEFKNRWSNVSPSDLMFLSSEMLNTESSNRFSSTNLNNNEQFSSPKATGNEETMTIREEMEIKRLFENKLGTMNSLVLASTSNSKATSAHASSSMNQGEKRSMSEITSFSRFGNLGSKSRTRGHSLLENNVKEERTRRLWLPIARRTVVWFATREKRPQQPQQPLDVESGSMLP